MIWYDMTWYDMILYIHDIWYFFPISYPYNMETHKICVFVSGSFLTKSSTWTFPLHTQGWYSSAKGVVVGLVVGWVVGSQLSSQGKTSSAKIAALLRTWMSEYWVGLGALSRSKQHRGSATGRCPKLLLCVFRFTCLRRAHQFIAHISAWKHQTSKGAVLASSNRVPYNLMVDSILFPSKRTCNGGVNPKFLMKKPLRFKKRNGDTLKGALAFIPWAMSPAFSQRLWCYTFYHRTSYHKCKKDFAWTKQR